MNEHFIISAYSSGWPSEFRAIVLGLRAAMGDLALRIDHIGSTSIPGLCAKDVIDIQITVAELQDPAVVPTVTAAGFEWRPNATEDHPFPDRLGPSTDWHKRYFRELPGTREIHVHVRRAGSRNQRYALLFRDYLRGNPDAATAYGQAKQRLAPHLQRDIYVEAKDPICDLIMQAAEMWAASGWSPGPSDA